MTEAPPEQRRSSPVEILRAFLLLGVTSFGGPIAHLGYFRNEFVARRRWLSEAEYADLVALCQFLPGPASSQVGFALGLMRGGYIGALLAWLAFTFPSVILLLLFASATSFLDGPLAAGAIHGLKLAAVAVVAHAVWGMARNLCPDNERTGIALAALVVAITLPGSWGQVMAIGIGALLGVLLCRKAQTATETPLATAVSPRAGILSLSVLVLLLIGLPLLAWVSGTQFIALADAFYRAGALVFGGGHVVLPLLEAEVVERGWMSASTFLEGYAAAQAVPGPLFTFAAYLGALVEPAPNGVLGASIAVVAIFLPGMLLLIGILPFWTKLKTLPGAHASIAGMNAGVVGLLGAALYDPVWTSAVGSGLDFALAAIAFFLLVRWQWAAWKVVLALTVAGIATAI
ncbi:chromate efflux transporter [Pseudomonas sp. Marseille-QA0892]